MALVRQPKTAGFRLIVLRAFTVKLCLVPAVFGSLLPHLCKSPKNSS